MILCVTKNQVQSVRRRRILAGNVALSSHNFVCYFPSYEVSSEHGRLQCHMQLTSERCGKFSSRFEKTLEGSGKNGAFGVSNVFVCRPTRLATGVAKLEKFSLVDDRAQIPSSASLQRSSRITSIRTAVAFFNGTKDHKGFKL